MPMRRFRRTSGRRQRRRTRWLSVVPGVIAGLASNTFIGTNLTLQDSLGAVSWSEFYGGTLLRVIMDVNIAHTISAGTPAPTSWILNSHMGIFLTPDSSVQSTPWDPNVPSGDFMDRSQLYQEAIVLAPVDGGGIYQYQYGVSAQGTGHHFDTKVKRRIVENSQLFLGTRHFITGPGLVGIDYGYTGRVLIALP